MRSKTHLLEHQVRNWLQIDHHLGLIHQREGQTDRVGSVRELRMKVQQTFEACCFQMHLILRLSRKLNLQQHLNRRLSLLRHQSQNLDRDLLQRHPGRHLVLQMQINLEGFTDSQNQEELLQYFSQHQTEKAVSHSRSLEVQAMPHHQKTQEDQVEHHLRNQQVCWHLNQLPMHCRSLRELKSWQLLSTY